ncbi:MAG: hypothetical protein IKS77_00470 [Spirochaetales bacterium]|nr:hypothetical protein [Spirochaetales bacterium]
MQYGSLRLAYAKPAPDPGWNKCFFVNYAVYRKYADEADRLNLRTTLPAASLAYSVHEYPDGTPLMFCGFSVRSPKDPWDRRVGRAVAVQRHDAVAVGNAPKGFSFMADLNLLLKLKIKPTKDLRKWYDFSKLKSLEPVSWAVMDEIAFRCAESVHAFLIHADIPDYGDREACRLILSAVTHEDL